jgi:hypothetical protein
MKPLAFLDGGEDLEIVAHSEDPDLFAQLKGADRG